MIEINIYSLKKWKIQKMLLLHFHYFNECFCGKLRTIFVSNVRKKTNQNNLRFCISWTTCCIFIYYRIVKYFKSCTFRRVFHFTDTWCYYNFNVCFNNRFECILNEASLENSTNGYFSLNVILIWNRIFGYQLEYKTWRKIVLLHQWNQCWKSGLYKPDLIRRHFELSIWLFWDRFHNHLRYHWSKYYTICTNNSKIGLLYSRMGISNNASSFQKSGSSRHSGLQIEHNQNICRICLFHHVDHIRFR